MRQEPLSRHRHGGWTNHTAQPAALPTIAAETAAVMHADTCRYAGIRGVSARCPRTCGVSASFTDGSETITLHPGGGGGAAAATAAAAEVASAGASVIKIGMRAWRCCLLARALTHHLARKPLAALGHGACWVFLHMRKEFSVRHRTTVRRRGNGSHPHLRQSARGVAAGCARRRPPVARGPGRGCAPSAADPSCAPEKEHTTGRHNTIVQRLVVQNSKRLTLGPRVLSPLRRSALSFCAARAGDGRG